MKLLRFAAAAVVCAGISSAQDLNRLQLDNGTDVLWLIQGPFAGLPVSNFDPTGDLYWKAFPADALQRCSGVSNLQGIEAIVFDTDFVSTEALWAYTVTAGTTGTDLTILPTFTGAGVFVPGTSTTGSIFGAPGGGCPAPGYVSGWIYTETFLDSTGAPTPLIPNLTSDGSTDWVFTHYFPAPGFADHDLAGGPINSCGGTGDATLQWGGSTDGQPTPTSVDGENQPDWTGFGNSIYGGFNIGGSGSFAPIPEGNDGGAELAWFFAEPTMQVRADAGDGFGVEVGLTALETPLQISSGGVPAGGTTTVGVRFFDQTASTAGTSFLLAAANVTTVATPAPLLPFIDTIGCLPFGSGTLGLNVAAGTGFSESFSAFSLAPFVLDANGEIVSDSVQAPLGTGAGWTTLPVTLVWQSWQFDALAGDIATGSNVFRNTTRFNNGL